MDDVAQVLELIIEASGPCVLFSILLLFMGVGWWLDNRQNRADRRMLLTAVINARQGSPE